MPNLQDFDEINKLNDREIIPIDQYFDEMELTDEEKEKRKKFAYELEDVMLFIFSLIATMREYGRMDKDYVIEQLRLRYSEVVLQYMNADEYIENYIAEFAYDTVDVTLRHGEEVYYTSDGRAIIISENEANTTFNYDEFREAIRKGYTKKQWVTEKDIRVRKTHRAVDSKVIPIRQAFTVGNSLMLFPKDTSLGASMTEIAGCRCTIRYLR